MTQTQRAQVLVRQILVILCVMLINYFEMSTGFDNDPSTFGPDDMACPLGELNVRIRSPSDICSHLRAATGSRVAHNPRRA
jgi:hypothetical protein